MAFYLHCINKGCRNISHALASTDRTNYKDKSFFALIGTDLLASGIMPQSHYKNKSKVSNLKLASTGCTKSVFCSSKKSDSLMALQH